MKNHLNKILTIALCFLFSTTLVAQHLGNIQKFTISPQYLYNGKLKVSNSGTTTFKYTVEFARTALSFSPSIIWNHFEMNVALSTAASNTELIVLTQPEKITNANFPADNAILTKEFTASISSSQFKEGKPIHISFTLNNSSSPVQAFSGKSYLPDFSNASGNDGGGGGGTSPANPVLQIPNTEYNKRFVVPGSSGVIKFYNSGNRTARVATNGNYRLDFQPDGNLVLYTGNSPIWASRTPTSHNGILSFASSGFVGVFRADGVIAFSASVPSKTNVIWVIQDDGNFVCYPGYYLDAQNNVIVTGTPIMATMTQGGKKSNRSGRLT